MNFFVEAVRGLNPFEDNAPKLDMQKVLGEVKQLAAKSPLEGTDLQRAHDLLKEMDGKGAISEIHPDDLSSIDYLVNTNETLYNSLKELKNLSRHLSDGCGEGIYSHQLPSHDNSAYGDPHTAVIQENKELHKKINLLSGRLTQKDKEIETLQLERVLDISQVNIFSQIGERIHKEPALNREFNQWIDHVMAHKTALDEQKKELLDKVSDLRQRLNKVMVQTEAEFGEISLEKEMAQADSLPAGKTVFEELELLFQAVNRELPELCEKITLKFRSMQEQVKQSMAEKEAELNEPLDQNGALLKLRKAVESDLSLLRDKYQKELLEKNSETEITKEQKTELNRKLAENQKNMHLLKETNEGLSASLKEIEAARGRLQAKYDELKQKFIELAAKSVREKGLQEHLEAAQDELAYLRRKQDNQKAELEAAKGKILRLEHDLTAAAQKLEIQAEENSLLDGQRRRLEREKAELLEKKEETPPSSLLEQAIKVDYEEILAMKRFMEQNPLIQLQFQQFALNQN